MTDLNSTIAEMRARYWDWYGNCAESGSTCAKGCTAPKTGDWSDQDPGENLSHCIVRNDVPELLAAVKAVVALVLTEDDEEWVRKAGGAFMVSGAAVLDALESGLGVKK